MQRPALILSLVLPLASCGWLQDTLSFGGDVPMPFRASVSPGEDRRDVTVSVTVPPQVTLAEFRESARLPVTRYCLESYGSSEADWAVDPATGDWALVRTPDSARLQARCTGRA